MSARLFLLSCFIHGILAADSLRFLVMGDWGGIPDFPYDTPWERAVAIQMSKVAEREHTSFTLALGDNFYEKGVTDVDDKRFKETFENVYKYKSLMTPWYLIAGNHDHYGNASAQLAYSKRSKRWNFPSFYYSLSFPVGESSKLDILMLDTVLLCGNTQPDWVHDQPGGPVNTQEAEDQWAWLENKLKTSTADYLLVTGHFPVYSIAEHGPTSCLVDRLKPLLIKYDVTAYMNGHDHNLQHIRSPEGNKTVHYITTGAANIVTPSKKHEDKVPADWVIFYWAELAALGGFTYVEATPTAMTFTMIDGLGRTLYKYPLLPRKVWGVEA